MNPSTVLDFAFKPVRGFSLTVPTNFCEFPLAYLLLFLNIIIECYNQYFYAQICVHHYYCYLHSLCHTRTSFFDKGPEAPDAIKQCLDVLKTVT